MGWCHAFGPQIREGCDHAMVAGSDSCSCAECAAVCRGLFPGCASVWAAGPRRVTLTKPTKESGNLMPVPTAVAQAAPKGPAPKAAAPQAAPSGAETEVVVAQVALEPSDVRALRIDMQVLMLKLDQLRQAAAPGDQLVQAAREIGAVATALPEQLREVVTSALEAQRRSMFKAFGAMERKIVDDIAQLHDAMRQAPEVPDAHATTAVSVTDLDSRFQWLVEAVSERFVTLGNELARIDRHLAVEPPDDTTTDRSGTNSAGMHGAGTNGAGANRAGTNGAGTNGGGTNGAGTNGDNPSPRIANNSRL